MSSNPIDTKTPIKTYQEPIILMGGSVINWPYLKSLPSHPIIAVDGGANALLEHGLTPDLITGDFDSIDPKVKTYWQSQNIEFLPLPDQNQTDFAKTLGVINAPQILAFGFLGARLDHGLDVLAQLSDHHQKPIYLIGENDIVFVLPSASPLAIKPKTRISFWSAGECHIESSQGLKWPLKTQILSAAQMSISNETLTNQLSVKYQGAPLIVLCELAAVTLE